MNQRTTQEVNLRLPKLTTKANFHSWNQAFTRYAGSLQLKYLLKYKVAESEMVLSVQTSNTTAKDNLARERTSLNMSFLKTLPITVRNAIVDEEVKSVKVHLKDSFTNIPTELVPLVVQANLIVVDGTLYLIFEDSKDLLKFRINNESFKDKLFTVMFTTVEKKTLQLINNFKDPIKAYE